MSRKFAENDILGRFPVVEMNNPEEWLLSEVEFEAAWQDYKQSNFPDRWFAAERKLRSDRLARTMLMGRGDEQEVVGIPDALELAVQLLEEAVTHLPDELAERVRAFLKEH